MTLSLQNTYTITKEAKQVLFKDEYGKVVFSITGKGYLRTTYTIFDTEGKAIGSFRQTLLANKPLYFYETGTEQPIAIVSRPLTWIFDIVDPKDTLIAKVDLTHLKTMATGTYWAIMDKDNNKIAEIKSSFSQNISSKAKELFTGNEDHTVNILNKDEIPQLILLEIIAALTLLASA